MKKIKNIIFSTVLLILILGCSGYKPIFGFKNLNFKISEYSIKGDKIIGKQIYSKLNNLSKLNKNDQNSKMLDLLIDVKKNKEVTSKDEAGKILEYKIILSTKIIIKDSIDEKEIINRTYVSSIIYKIQDLHSNTIKLENTSIQNLIDKTYQELLIKLSETLE